MTRRAVHDTIGGAVRFRLEGFARVRESQVVALAPSRLDDVRQFVRDQVIAAGCTGRVLPARKREVMLKRERPCIQRVWCVAVNQHIAEIVSKSSFHFGLRLSLERLRVTTERRAELMLQVIV